MTGTRRKVARGFAAGVASLTLVATGVAIAPMADAAAPGTTLRVAITDHGLYLNGPTTFPAGRVNLWVDASGKSRCANIARLAPGYTFHQLRKDVLKTFTNFDPQTGAVNKKGLKHLNRFIDNTTAYGGFYAPDGKIRHGSDLLSTPGSYVLLECTSLPRRPVALTVTSPSGAQELQNTSATIRAITQRRFRGDTTLPADGNITFKNRSTESPHFMSFTQMKKGTTRRDVINAFSGNGPDPTKKNGGSQDSDILSMGQTMVLHLKLPPGRYALMCFFPDPKTGRDHASMGMIRMVNVKG